MARQPRQSREARRFLRAAEHRLAEAKFLLESEFYSAAVYLGGYAVECMLKALILASEPVHENSTTLLTFRGAVAHDYNWLNRQLVRRRVILPTALLETLRDVGWWSTDLRYDPKDLKGQTAEEFLAGAEALFFWGKGRLP